MITFSLSLYGINSLFLLLWYILISSGTFLNHASVSVMFVYRGMCWFEININVQTTNTVRIMCVD